jgi:hypothetical protein
MSDTTVLVLGLLVFLGGFLGVFALMSLLEVLRAVADALSIGLGDAPDE